MNSNSILDFNKIFKESLKDLTKELNKDKSQRSLRNRLRSINHDAKYVLRINEILKKEIGRDIPIIANERCGSWYVEPKKGIPTVYFKSTDGHTNEWCFSFKRLNFHLLEFLSYQSGVMIIDSTRRGKTIPDSLSKTIPIWCATLNYFMFGPPENNLNGKNWFYYPEETVSSNEASKIIDLIPQFSKQLEDLNIISREKLKEKLNNKSLRPYWIHPQIKQCPVYSNTIPLILCCCSERVQDGVKSMADGWVYVQGAADDEELWSNGLTYKDFWKYLDLFMGCLNDEDIEELIGDIKERKKNNNNNNDFVKEAVEELVEITDKLSIGKIVKDLTNSDIKGYENVIILSKNYKSMKSDSKLIQHFPIQCNKKGSNDLRKYLPLVKFIPGLHKTLILDESGKDLSIGVLLIFLTRYHDLQWNIITDTSNVIGKTIIKQHLAKINMKKVVNPSRATLQSINSYLM